jgi:tetratricopeptide (TPR) repeat protein
MLLVSPTAGRSVRQAKTRLYPVKEESLVFMNDQDSTLSAAKLPCVPPRNPAQAIVILLAILLAAGPLAYSFGRRELARWCQAAAYERLLEGDLDGALAKIDRAVRWHPRDANLMMRRASWKMRTGTIDTALTDCDLALELARGEFASRRSEASQILLALALNQRAYAYALADANLEEALEQVQQALDMLGDDYSLLDTRGYLHLKLGHLEEAQRDLERAVERAESGYKLARMSLRHRAREMVDTRPIAEAERLLDEGLAVLTHHRGELYQRLGRMDEAARDIQRARRIGYDPAKGVW